MKLDREDKFAFITAAVFGVPLALYVLNYWALVVLPVLAVVVLAVMARRSRATSDGRPRTTPAAADRAAVAARAVDGDDAAPIANVTAPPGSLDDQKLESEGVGSTGKFGADFKRLMRHPALWGAVGAIVLWQGIALVYPDKWSQRRQQAAEAAARRIQNVRGVSDEQIDRIADAQLEALKSVDRRIGGRPGFVAFVHSLGGAVVFLVVGFGIGFCGCVLVGRRREFKTDPPTSKP